LFQLFLEMYLKEKATVSGNSETWFQEFFKEGTCFIK